MRKTLALFLTLVTGIYLHAGGLSLDLVPPAVQNYVKHHFPEARRVKWDFEKDENLYEADFKLGGFDHELRISPEGELIRSEIEIREKMLPKNVQDYIRSNYPKSKVDIAKVIVNKESIVYRIIIAQGSLFNKKYQTLQLDPQNLPK